MSVQRPLSEARANEFPHAERGITLGTVLEHPESGDWAIVTDVRDDGRLRFLNLEEIPDASLATLEPAVGCVEHAEIARGMAASTDDAEYVGPPELFDVLGPTHPEWQRSDAAE